MLGGGEGGEGERSLLFFWFFCFSFLFLGKLFYLDYLASCNQVDFAAQGYCSYMAPAVLDRFWSPGLDEAAALALMHKVIDQIKTRLAFSQAEFIVKIISADGVKVSYH